MEHLGQRVWAIPEGFVPGASTGPASMTSHETACILNTGDADAHVEITLFFPDREPAGPYHVTVPARRTRHQRFRELVDDGALPTDADYASVLVSDVPVVVQHTRLDSRQPANALLSTIAFAAR
ncbi:MULTISPECIES: sensory rhodopsin transducer [unclassified Streptomyces]|uniref:sensory rhodopsin transducer n=1 Tax=unclassified Streptomyces TaxID=2593676 RepID=UPI003D74B9CF